MIYQAYQTHTDVFAPFRMAARASKDFLNHPWFAFRDHPMLRHAAAACELISRAGLSHHRPEFEITHTRIAGAQVAVQEELVENTPFCGLLRFRKESPVVQPRILLVAPLSGHFATLLLSLIHI